MSVEDHLFGYAGGVAGVDHLAHVLVAFGGLLHHLIVVRMRHHIRHKRSGLGLEVGIRDGR